MPVIELTGRTGGVGVNVFEVKVLCRGAKAVHSIDAKRYSANLNKVLESVLLVLRAYSKL